MIKSNLAVLLAERRLKIIDVWKATGISRTTLHGLYHNTSAGIQYETLDKLCNFLKVTPAEFFLYHQFDYKVWGGGPASIVNGQADFSIDIEYSIRGKEYKDLVDVIFEVDEYFLDNPSQPVMGATLHFYLPKNLYDELDDLPVLFRDNLENDLVQQSMDATNQGDVLNVTTLFYIQED